MQRNNHYQDYSHPQYTQTSTDPLEEVLGIFPCVKLRGLPFEATAKRADYYLAASLRLKSEQMFAGSGPSSYANSSGFRGPPARMAVPAATPTEHTGVIRMRGLPFNVTVEDIMQFFRAYNVQNDAVKIAYRYDGRPTGEAFVTFDSADTAAKALTLDRGEIGSRYIELFISSPEAFARV